MKKLLPIVFLLIGSGAGVGAGIFLRPAPDQARPDQVNAESKEGDLEKPAKEQADAENIDRALEYLKLSNQFVVPVVRDRVVTSLVVMSLSLEIPEGTKEAVFKKEPKVRDSFLQVMFDHANIGGFDGSFTDAQMLAELRHALREVAQRDLGEDAVQSVLITEIARQDY